MTLHRFSNDKKSWTTYISLVFQQQVNNKWWRKQTSGWNGELEKGGAWWRAETSTHWSWLCLMQPLSPDLRFYSLLSSQEHHIHLHHTFHHHSGCYLTCVPGVCEPFDKWVKILLSTFYFSLSFFDFLYLNNLKTGESKYCCGLCNLPLCSEACQVIIIIIRMIMIMAMLTVMIMWPW